MANSGSNYSLYSVRAAFLLFVLLRASAVSAFIFQQQPTTRCCAGAHLPPRAMTLTTSSTSLRVSTMAGDWDMAEEEEEERDQQQQQERTGSSLLQQHRQLQLRAAAAQAKQASKKNEKPPAPPPSLAPELELPRHTVAVQERRPLATAERMLGRVSMVAALVLLANELVSGQSLPDQIFSVLTVLSN